MEGETSFAQGSVEIFSKSPNAGERSGRCRPTHDPWNKPCV